MTFALNSEYEREMDIFTGRKYNKMVVHFQIEGRCLIIQQNKKIFPIKWLIFAIKYCRFIKGTGHHQLSHNIQRCIQLYKY